MNYQLEELIQKAREIREEVIKMLVAAGSGHSAGSLGMAEVMAVLFFSGVMKYRAKKPDWPERDRLILSAGHICPVLYASMAIAGYFKKEELKRLRRLGSRLQGHPTRELAGIELAVGGLGQGLSVGAGMALAAKHDKKDWRVMVVMSDGEQQEGQTWEAATFASKYRLSGLIGLIDNNDIQISGKVSEVMPLGDMKARYKAIGWQVEVIDGNYIEEVKSSFERAYQLRQGPTVIICQTIPGKGVSFMEGDYRWHGKAPTKEEGERALAELRQAKKT